jgi:high-affinity iron transporter
MFLNSVILILQEMIEAALLVSVLLVFTHLFQKSWDESFVLRSRWLIFSIAIGSIGAAMYSYFTPQISEMFDYVGQEVFNASIHILSLLLVCLLAFMVPSAKLALSVERRSQSAAFCMAGIVMFAIIREGSEIIQYVGGIAGQEQNFTPVVVGGFIGAGIGISTGVLLFYGLVGLSATWSFRLSLLLLCLIAGNMGSQAVLLLTQADWLPYTAIAWDSSSALPENSIFGQLLYALIGYEATPSILQVSIYLLGIVLILVSPLFRKFWPPQQSLVGEV